MRRRLFLVAALFLGACSRPPEDPLRRFPLKGEVVRLDPKTRSATLKHENIEGFMEAMTMDFPVKDPAEFAKLAVGQNITATVVQRPTDFEYWIENIKPVP